MHWTYCSSCRFYLQPSNTAHHSLVRRWLIIEGSQCRQIRSTQFKFASTPAYNNVRVLVFRISIHGGECPNFSVTWSVFWNTGWAGQNNLEKRHLSQSEYHLIFTTRKTNKQQWPDLIKTEEHSLIQEKEKVGCYRRLSSNLWRRIIVPSTVWRSVRRPLTWRLTRDSGRSCYGIIFRASQRTRDRVGGFSSWARDDGVLTRAAQWSTCKNISRQIMKFESYLVMNK